ncbi:MAG: hypothetical protein D3906_08885 [Candidatus Electrothrix sp. AUS1_2]|nr:hypothetical protein [Candidatus Electrothrix sp. AUS1_2]
MRCLQIKKAAGRDNKDGGELSGGAQTFHEFTVCNFCLQGKGNVGKDQGCSILKNSGVIKQAI